MSQSLFDYYKEAFQIREEVLALSSEAEREISDEFCFVNMTRERNQLKVIKAMQNNKLSDVHFAGTTGYGYDDRGRDVLDSVYAEVFGAEDALVRHHFVSGTHALSVALSGNILPGEELISITGKPYDTLDEVIGIRGKNPQSLQSLGILYKQIELLDDGSFDFERIERNLTDRTKIIFIQRSKGYSIRPTINVAQIKDAIYRIKSINSKVAVLVDNCYGEFTEELEPTEVGADLIVGSLIKNPGGGLASTGGYIAGKREFVHRAAERLTSPGLGKKVGASLGFNRQFFQGLFLAPHVVSESLKGAIYCAEMMKRLGFGIIPDVKGPRSDIIQSILFRDERALILFCQGIQAGSAVDSFVTPEPWDMPGYDSQVIMAAGAFIQGASIELSADAPIKPPYIAYMQGGLVFEHVKLGVMIALSKMLDEGLIQL